MGVVIAFSDDPQQVWLVAGWAFRQVRDDVLSRYPQDSEMAQAFAKGEAINGLLVDKLEPDLAARITRAIRRVVTDILSGAIRSGIHDQPYGDSYTVEQYCEGLRELLRTIPPIKEKETA